MQFSMTLEGLVKDVRHSIRALDRIIFSNFLSLSGLDSRMRNALGARRRLNPARTPRSSCLVLVTGKRLPLRALDLNFVDVIRSQYSKGAQLVHLAAAQLSTADRNRVPIFPMHRWANSSVMRGEWKWPKGTPFLDKLDTQFASEWFLLPYKYYAGIFQVVQLDIV